MLTAVLVALAGLLVHDFVQWRIARWQAAETARLVRLAVFGPDGPASEDQRAVREALSGPPDVFDPVAGVVTEVEREERLGSSSIDDAVREALSRARLPDRDLVEHRSTVWAEPPQGSARARRKREEDR